jgi:5-methylcytosine-specific restriction endonuclease McrA
LRRDRTSAPDIVLPIRAARGGLAISETRRKTPTNVKHLRNRNELRPVAKGEPTSVANVRLLCRDCNRTKGDSIKELVYGMYWYMEGREEEEPT